MEEPCVCHPEGDSPRPVGVLGGTKLLLAEVLLVPGQNKAEFEAASREIKRF